ncbi:MAG: T9SS type A sorting domain-containing protein [Flavobacteriales bacterium]|nr:T9SS type A sorting domain-containing protein [Flavobacteriales bacterium]
MLLGLHPLWLHAQGEWSLIFDPVPSKVAVYDALELPSGRFVLSLVSHTSNMFLGAPITRTWVVGVSETGGQEGLSELTSGMDRSVWVPQLVQHADDKLTALAMTWYHPTLSAYDITRYTLGLDGALLGATSFVLDDDSERIWIRNVSLLDGGELYVAGGLVVEGSTVPNRLLLVRIDSDGPEFQASVQGSGPGIRIGHHALSVDGTVLASIEGGGPDIGPSGFAKYLRFDDNFNVVGGFAMTSLSGTGNLVPPDSVLKDCMYMTLLEGDTIISSGRYNPISSGMRAALIRLAPDGAYAGMFLPSGAFFQEGPAGIQGHDLTPDGKLLFARIENFFTGPPNYEVGVAPSRVRVYRLDTLLNVECEFLLDGFEDNAYYYLMRIKAASDGGALLMGSRRDLNTMEQPRGWIMKLGPDQCYTGLGEHPVYGESQLYPNPGSDGFTLLLNGPVLRRGRLLLYDAQGREVAEYPINQSVAQVDARHLSSGMYLYRVLDPTGVPVDAGRWIKE